MAKYTINLTKAQDDALSFAVADQKEWIETAINHRCDVAINEIVQISLQKSFETGIQLPTSKDEIVELAFQKGWVKTAIERNAEFNATILV